MKGFLENMFPVIFCSYLFIHVFLSIHIEGADVKNDTQISTCWYRVGAKRMTVNPMEGGRKTVILLAPLCIKTYAL